MDDAVPATKDILLETAGELFADAGLDGVSIRAISKKAKVNIAAIHYHFGSKDNLYLEVVRHVMNRIRCTLAGEFIDTKEQWQDSPEACAEVVCRLVDERMCSFFPESHPHWYGRLFMRMLLDPLPALGELAEEIIMPQMDEVTAVFRLCKPSMTEREARCWGDTLFGQLSHYVFSKQFAQYIPKKNIYDSQFMETVYRHLSRVLLKGLDLPLPESLKDGCFDE